MNDSAKNVAKVAADGVGVTRNVTGGVLSKTGTVVHLTGSAHIQAGIAIKTNHVDEDDAFQNPHDGSISRIQFANYKYGRSAAALQAAKETVNVPGAIIDSTRDAVGSAIHVTGAGIKAAGSAMRGVGGAVAESEAKKQRRKSKTTTRRAAKSTQKEITTKFNNPMLEPEEDNIEADVEEGDQTKPQLSDNEPQRQIENSAADQHVQETTQTTDGNSDQDDENPTPAGVTPAIVFIGGLMSSSLLHEDGQVAEASDLALPIKWEKGVQATDSLVPGEVLSSTGSMHDYGDLMTWLRISGYEKNVDVTYWPYDWRRDNGETTDKFKDFLQNCAVPPMVIAHGNGGLIAFAAINETPDLVHSAILIGTPFGPGPNLFPDLENDALLPSAVMNTHAGFFACIGGSSGGDNHSGAGNVTAKKTGEELDLLDVEVWKQRGLGPFSLGGIVEQSGEAGSPQREVQAERWTNHISAAAAAAKKFRQRLIYASAASNDTSTAAASSVELLSAPCPIALVISKSFNTQKHATMNMFGKMTFGEGDPGDGVVRWVGAWPQEVAVVAAIESQEAHRRLPADIESVRQAIVQLLIETECAIPESLTEEAKIGSACCNQCNVM